MVFILLVRKEKLPSPRQFRSLLVVAFGAVLGFPLLTSRAMESLPVSHGAVELALLPLATAGGSWQVIAWAIMISAPNSM